MAATFHLTIASVSESLFDGEAVSITVPTAGGVLTLLARHEPLVTTIVPGTVSVRVTDEELRTFDVTAGVLEASSNQVSIIL